MLLWLSFLILVVLANCFQCVSMSGYVGVCEGRWVWMMLGAWMTVPASFECLFSLRSALACAGLSAGRLHRVCLRVRHNTHAFLFRMMRVGRLPFWDPTRIALGHVL